ncbi:CAP-Gly domain-containing linker protein 2 [Geodia barretti]|nr:CAP-Gly domain-containing linker protein 2 [Geodia barretti]
MAEVLPAQSMEERPDDKLPAIPEEDSSQPPPAPTDAANEHVSLPDIQKREMDSSTESLIKALGLSGADEKSLGRLLKTVRGQVVSTIDELRTITTHDNNLERQYKEVVSENVQLNSALEEARGEIRHLKGRLSVLKMTSPEIRKHKARVQFRERRKQDHERQLQQARQKYLGGEPLPVLDFAERARTVNARGEYIDCSCDQGLYHHRQQLHSRHSTYPPVPLPSQPYTVPLPPSTRPHTDPLPPPLLGCRCSVCNAQQSLGAVTLGSRQQLLSSSPLHSMPQTQSQQHRTTPHLTKSGQQILLGDRVIVKGERPGVVRYIGRLEADVLGQILIGVHLVMPVGTCDGSLRGRQYFQCPPLHGVFVRPADVLCVTGRKPCTGGTVVPRLQERAPFGTGTRRGSKLQTPLHWGPQGQEVPTPASSLTASTTTQARAILREELARVNAT